MLVLTRTIGQEVVIAGKIRIRLIRAGSKKARLGIIAPKGCRIDRLEVHEARLREEQSR